MKKGKIFPTLVSRIFLIRESRENKKVVKISGFTVDLQDAYFHVPIHPSSRKYLRFAFENKVYQFQVLPFGLNTASQVFTQLGHTVAGYLHRLGIWQVQLLSRLNLVSVILNEKKSELDLVQDIQFLGIRLRLD